MLSVKGEIRWNAQLNGTVAVATQFAINRLSSLTASLSRPMASMACALRITHKVRVTAFENTVHLHGLPTGRCTRAKEILY